MLSFKFKKIMLICADQESGNEIRQANTDKSIEFLPVFPDNEKTPASFQGMLWYFKDEVQKASTQGLYDTHHHVPIKAECSNAGEVIAKAIELKAAFAKLHDTLKETFKKIDADGSGDIDIWEFRDALYESGQEDDGTLDEAMKEVDTNGDG